MLLADRMELYESIETGRRFIPGLPIIARLDGRSFHSFTRKLRMPYDKRLSDLMVSVTEFLVKESCAKIGYTQSDEITLIFYSDSIDSQIFFAGKPYKMISILAAMCSVHFNGLLPACLPEKANAVALFDCRVWAVPSKKEAINVLMWREQDATRNSISMAAHSCYSHKELHQKNTSDMQEMLFQEGINWNDYPAFFKRGVYVQRAKVERKFTCNEIESLPPLHEARGNPNLMLERTVIRTLDMPPILRVENRTGVVFDGEMPEIGSNCLNLPLDRVFNLWYNNTRLE